MDLLASVRSVLDQVFDDEQEMECVEIEHWTSEIDTHGGRGKAAFSVRTWTWWTAWTWWTRRTKWT